MRQEHCSSPTGSARAFASFEQIASQTLPVILSLLDQLYQARQQLFKLSAAVAAQDDTMKMAIPAAIHKDAKLDNELDLFREDHEERGVGVP